MKKGLMLILGGCILLGFLSGCNQEAHLPEGWTSYATGGFVFSAPEKLEISTDEQEPFVLITHKIPSHLHQPFCDFKGDEPETDIFTDFDVSLHVENGTPLDVMKMEEDAAPFPFDVTEAELGGFTGYQTWMGIEGCGETDYYLSLDKDTTLIVREGRIPELTDLNLDKDLFWNLSGVILPEEYDEILSGIVRSLKVK